MFLRGQASASHPLPSQPPRPAPRGRSSRERTLETRVVLPKARHPCCACFSLFLEPRTHGCPDTQASSRGIRASGHQTNGRTRVEQAGRSRTATSHCSQEGTCLPAGTWWGPVRGSGRGVEGAEPWPAGSHPEGGVPRSRRPERFPDIETGPLGFFGLSACKTAYILGLIVRIIFLSKPPPAQVPLEDEFSSLLLKRLPRLFPAELPLVFYYRRSWK